MYLSGLWPSDEGEELIRHPHTASIIVGVGEESTFQAVFKPDVAHRFEGSIRVTVMDNQYEDRVIQMVGEGYQDEITLDNIHSIPAEENVEALLENDNQVSGRSSRFKGHSSLLAKQSKPNNLFSEPANL